MICISCHKNFDDALELYNGNIACPHCGADLATVTDFKVTAENNERFRLSETYFFHSLELSNKNINSRRGASNSSIKKEWDECVENAIKHCRIAAYSGHPEAYWRMGFYYDKDYAGTSSTENQRCRIAHNFYRALADCDAQAPMLEGVSSTEYNDAWFKSLKKRAARDLLHMLHKAEGLSTGHNDIFDYDTAYKRFVKTRRYGEEIAPAATAHTSSVAKDEDKSKVGQIMTALTACSGRTRVPLFGYFYASQSDFERLTAAPLPSDERDTDFLTSVVKKNKDLHLVYIPCAKDGNARDDEYMVIGGEGSAPVRSEYISYTLGGYLAFINGKSSHMPDKSAPKKIMPKLVGNDDSPYRFFIDLIYAGNNKGNKALTFYCDDIIKFKLSQSHTYAKALDDLLEDMQN